MKITVARKILSDIYASNKYIQKALQTARKNLAIDDPDFYVLMRNIVGQNMGNEYDLMEPTYLEHPKLQPKWRRKTFPKLSKKKSQGDGRSLDSNTIR